MNNVEKINRATQNFKFVSQNGFNKGVFLPNWLFKKSKILLKETNGKIRPYYKQFKNGHIIMVDFGTNIGSEFCNNHLAVVLNKEDNKRNSMLCVIPLSSKDKKYYHKLNDEVFKLINERVVQEKKDLNEKLHSLIENINRIIKIQESLKFEEKGQKLDQEQLELIDELMPLLNSHNEESDYVRKKINELNEVSQKYSKFAENSFACIMNIQSISKLRIINLNPSDPSGQIRLSKSTMDALDKELIKKLTNVNIE